MNTQSRAALSVSCTREAREDERHLASGALAASPRARRICTHPHTRRRARCSRDEKHAALGALARPPSRALRFPRPVLSPRPPPPRSYRTKHPTTHSPTLWTAHECALLSPPWCAALPRPSPAALADSSSVLPLPSPASPRPPRAADSTCRITTVHRACLSRPSSPRSRAFSRDRQRSGYSCSGSTLRPSPLPTLCTALSETDQNGALTGARRRSCTGCRSARS